MSKHMTPQQNTASFALQSRLFVSMKRSGRVIDLVWFQQSDEYARAILSAADNMPDVEVRDISMKLREVLADYIAISSSAPHSNVAVLPVVAKATPAPVASTPSVGLNAGLSASSPIAGPDMNFVDTHPELDRHLTSLR